jgi:RNA recognition motif-containing protein
MKRGAVKQNNLNNNQRRVIIKNLPADFTEEALFKLFSNYGHIDIGFIKKDKGLPVSDDSEISNIQGSI